MTTEDLIEELLHKAYNKKKGREVIEKASLLMKAGLEKYLAYHTAYTEIVEKNEIYGERNKRQGETGENGDAGSRTDLQKP